MRITPELLRKLAEDNVAKRLEHQKDVVAVYLTGSVLNEDPLLGGTTDIDLVFVHKEQPQIEREIARISYEVSLDIVHHHQSLYTFHRRLRLNPWLGYALCNHAAIIYDTNHWLEFIQAGVFSQFDRPENVYGRSLPMLEKARSIWFELDEPQEYEPLIWFEQYFKAVSLSANAIAVLSGPALASRRFLLEFPSRSEAIGKPGLNDGLLGMLGIESILSELYNQWYEPWQDALTTVAKKTNCPPDLHPARKAYYQLSCEAMLESGNYKAAFYPMLHTWLQAVKVLWNEVSYQSDWLAFIKELGFTLNEFESRTASLDSFIDTIELVLDEWKSQNGL